ncbi:MAG: zinc ribbon domain-containing protein [Candidatus Omnitrophota bacterium]
MSFCIHCGQENSQEAKFCQHCGKSFGASEKIKWYFRGYNLFIGFLCVGPLILPLIWYHPMYSRQTKWILSVLILLVTIALGKAVAGAAHSLKEYYGLYDEILKGNY